MKFITKQLRLFFPHLFPLYWIAPQMPEGLIENLLREHESLSDMRSELLNIRLEGLEQKQELLSESFIKALDILSTPHCKQ